MHTHTEKSDALIHSPDTYYIQCGATLGTAGHISSMGDLNRTA